MTDVTEWDQPIAWGVLFVSHPSLPFDVPELLGGDAVRASASVVAVPVLHAQDVDVPQLDLADDEEVPSATVRVTCLSGAAANAPVEFSTVIPCAGGRMEIGDDEQSRLVSVAAGSVRNQLARASRVLRAT